MLKDASEYIEMFFNQETQSCQFFVRPGFDGLGWLPGAPERLYPVRLHWGVFSNTGDMSEHACGTPRRPSRRAAVSTDAVGADTNMQRCIPETSPGVENFQKIPQNEDFQSPDLCCK